MSCESFAIRPQLGKSDKPKIKRVLGDVVCDAAIELIGCFDEFAKVREQLTYALRWKSERSKYGDSWLHALSPLADG